MTHFATALTVVLASLGETEAEFYQDFRGGASLHAALQLFGPNLPGVTRHERQGLRITLSKNRKNPAPVGIEPKFHLSGDFEITLGYEILTADQPESGMGAGVKIWAKTAAQEFQALTLAHVISPEDENRRVAIFATEEDGERVFHTQRWPAMEKSGRLRLARVGKEVAFLVAEGESESFEELQRTTVGADDLASLRISVGAGDEPCGLSVRLVDLLIRAEGVPAASAPKGKRSRGWLVAGLMVVACGGAGAWFWVSRRPK